MAFPLPKTFRNKMATSASASDDDEEEEEPNPLGVSDDESESDAPDKKGDKPNPLKAWAQSKLMGTGGAGG